MLEDALGALEQEVPSGPGSEVVSEELGFKAKGAWGEGWW